MTTRNPYWFCLRLLVLFGVAFLVKKSFAADPPDFPPIVHLLATDPEAAEAGADTATFVVFRLGPTNTALNVQYAWGGTAANGADYATLSGTLTIPAGSWFAPITITPIDDSLVEGAESVILGLVQPLAWPPPYLVSWPSVGAAFIEDNDLPPTNRPPLVRLVNPPDGSVFLAPVDLKLVAHATDFDGRVVTVEFFDGTNSLGIVTNRPPIIRPIPLPEDAPEMLGDNDPALFPNLDALIDALVIPPTVFRLAWEDVPPGPHTLIALATDNRGATSRSEPVHIRVMDPPPQPIVNIRATDPEATEPSPTGARLDTATFLITRNGATADPLTVFYRIGGSAANGLDYAELPHSATIPAGARGVEVIVEPLDDNLVEGDESVVLALVPPVCIAIFPPPPDCYRVGREDIARAVIHDNDRPNHPPLVRIVRPEDGSVFLAPADLGIVAQARDPDGRVVTVEFFEGTNSLGIVTNNPGLLTTNTPQFAVKWPNVPPGHYVLHAVATDNDGDSARSRPVEIKVVERTLPPVVNITATDAEAAEVPPPAAPNTAAFAMTRTGDTDRPLLVHYSISGSASNGLDYSLLSGRLVIPAGTNSASLIVAPVDDRLVEGLETVGITLEPSPRPFEVRSIELVALPSFYVVGTNDSARAVIRDNDLAATNQPPKVAIVRPADGDVFTAPADLVLYAEAKDADGFVRTVEFFEGTNSLGIVSNSLSADPIANAVGGNSEQIFRLAWDNVPAGLYVLTAKATDNRGASSRSDPIRIKVVELQRQPVVTIEATDPWAAEGDLFITPLPIDPVPVVGDVLIDPITPILIRPNTATFTVKRDRGTNTELTVHYSLGGTAQNGLDYRRLSGRVTLPRGAWRAAIVVDPIDDHLFEGTETVIASLEPIACIAIFPPPPECYLVGDPARAITYIRDNDFSNERPMVEIVKPENEAIFVAPATIEISVLALDPDGYVTKVEFFAGTNKLGEDSRVFIIAPPPGELQRFSLTWSNVPPGRYPLTARATDDHGSLSVSEPVVIKVLSACVLPVVTIKATDDLAVEPFIAPPGMGIADRIYPAVFTVCRSCGINTDLRVSYSIGGTASNGVDYDRLSGVVIIPAGSLCAEIVVYPLDDRLVEDTETVILGLDKPNCLALDPPPVGCYLVGEPARDIAYIKDNDHEPNHPPRIAIVRPMQDDRFRAGSDIPIVAQTLDGDGYVPRVEFFADGRSIGVQEVLFFVAPPPGQLQRFSMIWSNVPAGHYALTAKATDDQGAMTMSGPVRIVVVDTDPIPLVNIAAPDAFAREGAPPNTATFVIRRTGATNHPLTVFYSIHGTASNGVDYVDLPDRVTIPAGRRGVRIIITPIDDRRPEGRETVILRLEDSHSYDHGQRRRAGIVISDNDELRPLTVRLPDGLFHLRNDGTNGFCYRLEASTDLDKWECLVEALLTDDALHFVDPESGEHPARFFRVVRMLEEEFFDED